MLIGLWKKGLVLGIILLFVGSGVIPSMGGTVVDKRSNYPISKGKTLYVGGSGEGNYSRIKDAINDSSDGDTVYVYDDSSPYYENLFVDKSINLIGENKETTVIDGNNIELIVVYVCTDWVTISGFTIQNSKHMSWVQDGGIVLGDKDIIVRYTTITNNIITSNEGSGIYSGFRTYWNIITDNIIINNGVSGIGIMSYCSIISGNNISSNNEFGIALGGHDNNILGNTINSNKEYGLSLWNSCNNIVTGNNISSNNKNGILIVDNSNNNIIYHNNLINNSQNANDECDNIWDNGKSGNYWDDYTGEDKDGDGIGDTPYPIPGGDNEDKYPLMKPWGENNPPNTPVIEGKRKFKEGEGGEYPYTINSTDPDGDYVKYFIDWGDNNTMETDWHASGEEITINVTIPLETGTYVIFKIKAKDVFGLESDWATLEVTVPRNKATVNSLFHWFLERFPLLERLLSLIRVDEIFLEIY